MTLPHRKPGLAAGAAVAILSAIAFASTVSVAFAQQPMMTPDQMSRHGHGAGMTQIDGPTAMPGSLSTPTMPGQDAFGAIQEIVRMLEADPDTDWSKVDLEGLRQHLVDMNDVTLEANAAAKPIEGGLEIAVTGDGRTRAAIQRMVPAHAHELDRLNGWSARTEPLPNGILLTVTSRAPKEVQHIRGLGFAGLLVTGSHHQAHHLAMAKGAFSHRD